MYLRKLAERCDELGCVLIKVGVSVLIAVPIGKRVTITGDHIISQIIDRSTASESNSSLKAILSLLEYGLCNCNEQHCIYCEGFSSPMDFYEIYGGVLLAPIAKRSKA